jgi:hypothetical protein
MAVRHRIGLRRDRHASKARAWLSIAIGLPDVRRVMKAVHIVEAFDVNDSFQMWPATRAGFPTLTQPLFQFSSYSSGLILF